MQGYVRLAVVCLEIFLDDDDVMIDMIDISYEMGSNSLRASSNNTYQNLNFL